jgi:hypothetical protein
MQEHGPSLPLSVLVFPSYSDSQGSISTIFPLFADFCQHYSSTIPLPCLTKHKLGPTPDFLSWETHTMSVLPLFASHVHVLVITRIHRSSLKGPIQHRAPLSRWQKLPSGPQRSTKWTSLTNNPSLSDITVVKRLLASTYVVTFVFRYFRLLLRSTGSRKSLAEGITVYIVDDQSYAKARIWSRIELELYEGILVGIYYWTFNTRRRCKTGKSRRRACGLQHSLCTLCDLNTRSRAYDRA